MDDFELTTPVVFIIFNRYETAIQVFERIREVKPSKLLVIADGPRDGKFGEVEKCQKCRDIIKNIDWPCKVFTNYSNVNLGTKLRISSGLNWVFENVEEAIILEDDCVPDQSFFSFCQMMLETYRENKDIMAVSGTNLLYGTKRIERKSNKDYYFSKISGNWGWATWKRSWNKFDIEMKSWKSNKEINFLKEIFEKPTIKFWNKIFQDVYDGKIETAWDYQWYYSILSNEGICIMPHGNLIKNIGFGENATNTFDANCEFAKMEIIKLNDSLIIEKEMLVNSEYDDLMNKYFYSMPTLYNRLKNKVLRLIN